MELNKFENILVEFKKIYVKREKNVFEIAGFPKRERVSSNILKFYLDGTEEHKLGTMVLEALLKAANINSINNINDVIVDTEYYTTNGNAIDLILYNDEFVLGIENKIEAEVYNDLQDYATMLEKFNPNAYKIILSLYDETESAKENNYINVTYEKLFKCLEPMLNSKPQPNNKWYIYLQDFISNIKRLGGNKMENQEMLEWAKNNKKNIEEFYNFLLTVKKELNNKSTELGKILAEKIKNLKLNGRVWYWNKSR